MHYIKVNIENQLLSLYSESTLIKSYPVSTSAYGIGCREGSFQTPLGHHRICEKIGADKAADEVFIGREAKGGLAELKATGVELPEDIITARILRLVGMEEGLNKGPSIDSFERYIYIHGTADEVHISQPVSHGCVRMKNNDIIELFEKVELNADVWIEA